MVTTGISTMRMSATLLSEALGVEAMQATLGVDLHVDLMSHLDTQRSSKGLHFGEILGGKEKLQVQQFWLRRSIGLVRIHSLKRR